MHVLNFLDTFSVGFINLIFWMEQWKCRANAGVLEFSNFEFVILDARQLL